MGASLLRTRPGVERGSGERSWFRPWPRPRSGGVAAGERAHCNGPDLRILRVEQTSHSVDRLLTDGCEGTDVGELKLLIGLCAKSCAERRNGAWIFDFVQRPGSDLANVRARVAKQIDHGLWRLPWRYLANRPHCTHADSRRAIVQSRGERVDRRVVANIP